MRDLLLNAHFFYIIVKFVAMHDIPETTVRVYRRHLMLDRDAAEAYIEYLISVGRCDAAASVLGIS